MPVISVLMPVYNGEKYIEETIKSVLGQTYADFEYIIVDDGSTDKTIDIVKSFSDPRIMLIRANHGGIVKALNSGLAAAHGEYIVRIDADDICMPPRFAKLYNFMNENRHIDICGSWAETINERGQVVGEMKYPPEENKDIRKYALIHNPFIHPSVIIRKKALDKVGPYQNFKHTEDYELWSRLLKAGEGHNIQEKLIKYRIHPDQITGRRKFSMRIAGIKVRFLTWMRLGI